MPKILLMIDEGTLGGGQQHVALLAEGLKERGFSVTVACPGNSFLSDRLTASSVRHLPHQLTKSLSPRSLFATRALLRSESPDILHTHGGFAGFYGRLAARQMKRTATVHTYHGLHYLHFSNLVKRLVYRSLDRYLAPETDAIICVAASDATLALAAGVAREGAIHVIPNGIDVDGIARTARAIREQKRALRKRVVGTVGRLHAQKGHVHFLHAARKVLDVRNDVEFHIVGDGPLRGSLEAVARDLSIADRVRFFGSRTDAVSLLAEMDVFVLSSLWEGLPLVVLEAMAAERPLVCTSVDGVRDIVRDGESALLVPPADSESLAGAILRVLDDEPLCRRMTKRASEIVRQQFTVEQMVERTADVYRSLLARHGD